jgi:Fe-S cluster assembly protein SufD
MSAAPSSASAHYQAAYDTLRPQLAGDLPARDAAMARFAVLGFPQTREEAWRYTSLRRLEARRFTPAAGPVPVPASLPVALVPHRLVLTNGAPPETPPSRLAGFAVGAQGATGPESLPQPRTGGDADRFVALNAALTPGPVRLAMDAGQQDTGILQLTLLTTGTGPTLASPRIEVRMGAGSRGRLLLEHLDDGTHEHFSNAVLDVELGAGAHLTVYRLQQHGDKAFHIERIEARLAEDASFVLRDSQLGGSLSRLDVNVSLDGRSASTEVTGVFLADASRHLDTRLQVDHRGVGTSSLQDYRGIAANKGRGVFNGKSVVHIGAQQSNARQVSRNLLLTPGAEIDTKPDLEIYADDVKCSHGATTGQLDASALFYLRSRGLGESEARSALTRAFAGAVLARVDVPALSARVQHELDQRLLRLLETAA